MNPQYRCNAKEQLLRDLPFRLSKDIDSALQANNYHYLPSFRMLQVLVDCASSALIPYIAEELCFNVAFCIHVTYIPLLMTHPVNYKLLFLITLYSNARISIKL